MCYPVWDGAYERILAVKLNRITHVVAAVAFLSLYEWSFILCPMPYDCKKKKNVLNVASNKTFPFQVVTAAKFEMPLLYYFSVT